MHILFTSTKGTGHLSPLLPYAAELLQKGHQVRVAAPDGAADVLSRAGLPHVVVDSPSVAAVQAVLERAKGLSPDEITVNFTRGVFADLNSKAALPMVRQTIKDWRPNLIVRESAEFAGVVAAELAAVPHVRVAVHCGLIEERLIDSVLDVIDDHRREVGLAPDGGETLRKTQAFTAFPSILDGRPAAARTSPPVRARDAGSSFEKQSHRPRWFLDDWDIADERPLIYITFGTEAGTSAWTQAAYRTALHAVRDLPARVLLTTGPNMQPADLGPIPGTVAVERFVPQAEVLPWCGVVLCHGGSGTLLGAAALGVPMVITPLFADQFANARNLEAAGAGLAILDGDAASVEDALRRVLRDRAFPDAASAIRAEMAGMQTIEEAVGAMLDAAA